MFTLNLYILFCKPDLLKAPVLPRYRPTVARGHGNALAFCVEPQPDQPQFRVFQQLLVTVSSYYNKVASIKVHLISGFFKYFEIQKLLFLRREKNATAFLSIYITT